MRNWAGYFKVFAIVVFLAGCATPARVDQMTARASASSIQPTFLKSSIAIGSVAGGEETNPLWVSNVSSADFSRALEDSLRNSGLLASSREKGTYLLSAHLNALEQPFIGLDMTVTATVNYVLTQGSTGNEMYRGTIAAPFTATVSDALLGIERLKIANEGAVRENLTRLVTQLYALKPGSVILQSGKSRDEQLQDAKVLFDKGLISREVYLEQQKKILASP